MNEDINTILNTEFMRAELEKAAEIEKKIDDTTQLLYITDADEVVIELLHLMYALVEQQEIIYTRLSLAGENDRPATNLKRNMEDTTEVLGAKGFIESCMAMKDQLKENLRGYGQDIDSDVE
jgi:uncharacterized protein YpuA (DUF1002 family)